jgi:uncharacterized membrane protein
MNKLRDLIVDGLFLALPVGFGAFLAYKLVGKLGVLIAPANYFTPEAGWAKFIAVEAAALLVLIILLLLLGLFSRSRPGRRLVQTIEAIVLSKVPGYMILKTIAADVVHEDDEEELRPAIVRDGIKTVLGLIVEQSQDGSTYTVFLPTSPGAMSGNVTVFPKESVQILGVSAKEAIRVLKMRGLGLQALLHAPQKANSP